jgi:Patatin-like phospholipase
MATTSPNPGIQCDELDFTPRLRFHHVITEEYEEVHKRRAVVAETEPPPDLTRRPPKITGLALSGGGVRSATFNLGMLQALSEKLNSFDYLSTVSGGGYVGGWWSAWLSRDERKPKEIFPPAESIESQRDDRRAEKEDQAADPGKDGQPPRKRDFDRPQIKDSAISAADDPIHHLRLFSNVMTPRKGLLSSDTWRAIAVVGRNISLTWMILLPILLAAIMIGQAWFTLAADDPSDLYERLSLALEIPALLYLGSVVCVVVWMFFGRRSKTIADWAVVLLSTAGFFALTYLAFKVLSVHIPKKVWVSLGLWLVCIVIWLVYWKIVQKATGDDREFFKNRVVVLQTKTLTYSVFSLVILLFSAFGYVLFDLLLTETQHKVAQAGGWGAFALAAASAIYTALKAAPTGGGDNTKATDKPPLLQRLAFAVGPILLLLVLGIVLSWIGNKLYWLVFADHTLTLFVTRGALISATLFLVFALYEFRPPRKSSSYALVVVWLIVAAGAFWVDPQMFEDYLVKIGGVTLSLLAAALVLRAFLRKLLWIGLYAAALGGTAVWFFRLNASDYILRDERIPVLVVAGIAATLALLVFELLQGKGANTRSITLTVIACTIFVLIGAAAGAGDASAGYDYAWRALTLVGLVAATLGWVLALGWLADPNSLSIHGFYKARLVRAYMGASNPQRRDAKDADITDAVPGDDLLLTKLRNTEQGAPYHLINTMLNLVGGSDLTTQARASDSFLMSKRFCGSVRTGYRKTSEYSCGSISLGTAVAVSGAAASPSMGAQSPSAALSALMTLFNVRLGFWAPTPSLSYWRSGAARLWPVYTLQELISQTTDLLPYCNLTDGGHYENTGAYSLVQRGCNLIVVGECGADPKTTLDDLGNMIRKVRIDFGTEITFNDQDIAKLRANPPGAHVIVGRILYGKDHADAIRLPETEREATIIIVKPNLSGGEPVDVKQYGYLHSDFPQQNTFDLWYDEAQFESYRRLGRESGQAAVAIMNAL